MMVHNFDNMSWNSDDIVAEYHGKAGDKLRSHAGETSEGSGVPRLPVVRRDLSAAPVLLGAPHSGCGPWAPGAAANEIGLRIIAM